MNKKSFFSRIAKFIVLILLVGGGRVSKNTLVSPVSANSPCVPGPHGGTISSDETWCLIHSPHIIEEDVIVPENVTLTIEPGVRVEFVDMILGFEFLCYCDLIVNGTLQASGTLTQTIRFTSGMATPGEGDWGQVYFGDYSTGNTLDYVLVEYGGSGISWSPMVYVSTDDLLIDHSIIQRSDYTALKIYNASPTVRNTTFTDNNGSAIYLDGGSAFPLLSNLTASGNNYDAITINGATIGQDYTWGGTGISTYRIVYDLGGTEDVTVDPGATLTIEPGTTVKLASSSVDLIINGTLNARGALTQTIRFTSDSPTPAKGNWGKLYFGMDSLNNHLDYALVEYGGYLSEPMVYVSTDDLLIDHSTIQRSNYTALEIYNASPTVRNTTFTDNNGSAIYLDGGSAFPVLSNLTASGNGYDAITINGATVSQDYTWGNAGISTYRILRDIIVDPGATLTIEPGTTVKFNSWEDDLIINGTLNARGTLTQTIRFTSDSPTPAKGDWGQLHFEQASQNSVLEYALVEYGGGFLSDNILAETSSLTIRHSTIARSIGAGIRLNGGAPVIERNSIVENDGYGLDNDDVSVTAVAWCNWWGDASGPYHPTLNPGGLGQQVSDNVLFFPWLTDPNARCNVYQIFLPLIIR